MAIRPSTDTAGPLLPVERVAPRQFALRVGKCALELRLGDVGLVHEPSIDVQRAAGGDRPHRQFRLPRHAELAHQQHIERRVQRLGHFKTDRHATAWQREHDHVVTLRIAAQMPRERTARCRTVEENAFHDRPPHG